MAIVATELADRIEAEVAAVSMPERAENEKRYLKSDLTFLGASVPAIRKVVKGIKKEYPELAHDEVVALVRALWQEPIHERRMAAVEVAILYGDTLDASDMDLVEELLRQSKTWALVDNLAAAVAGPLVERDPELGATLDRWAADPDFWIRRSALLVHLGPLRGGGGDFDRFARYADAMLDETEFFIRKAIGWVLRETGRHRPDLVYEWLAPRTHRASGVTMREATKRLPDEQRKELMAAYRERRPARAE